MSGLFALGYKTFVATWKSLGPPSLFGTLLYTNPNACATYFPRFRRIFHGTVQQQLGGQHLNGKFRNENRNIYFTHRPNLAAFYVKDYDNPVLLELSSSKWAKIDFRFWERYFPAGPNIAGSIQCDGQSWRAGISRSA